MHLRHDGSPAQRLHMRRNPTVQGMIIDVHNSGGSGPFGNSAYANRLFECPEKQRLKILHPQTCDQIYRPGKGDAPNAMLVGTIVHAYAEAEAKDEWKEGDGPAEITDSQCDWTIPQNTQDEAWRVFDSWHGIRTNYAMGADVLGVELHLSAGVKETLKGPEYPIDALIDRLVRDPDGAITIEDLKTSGRSGDNHSTGRTRLQLHLYCIAAWLHGYDVQRLRVRQIVKTKEVKEELFEIDLPTPTREAWIARYLKGALAREAIGPLGPWGSGCDYCHFGKNLICKL